MKKKFKFISILCALAIATTVFVGCGNSTKEAATKDSSQGGQVTLRFSWWGGDVRHKATLDVIDLYMKQNPNVKIEAEYGGIDGYGDKLSTQLGSGTAPDLIQVDNPWIYDYAKQGEMFYDLNEFKDIIDMSGFDKKFIDGFCTIDGKIQGLPMGLNAVTLLYNKDMLKNADIDITKDLDWDKLIEAGKKLHGQNSNNYLINAEQNNLLDFVIMPYVIQKTGQQWIKDDYTMGFDKAALTQAFELEKKMFDEGVLQPAEQSFTFNHKPEENTAWVNKQFGGAFIWAAGLGVNGKPLGDSADVTLVPVPKDAKDSGIQVRPATLLCINKKSPNAKEAAKFMNFFFNDKDAAIALGDVRSIPPVEASRQAALDAKKIDPLAVKAVDPAAKNSGLIFNANSNNQELRNILITEIENVAYKKFAPDKAADDLINQYNSKLQELKSAAN